LACGNLILPRKKYQTLREITQGLRSCEGKLKHPGIAALDHDGYLPSFAVITEGKVSDVKVAHTLRLDPGTIVVYDRGYNDYLPVKIQIWTARIAMLILRFLQLKSRYAWSLSNLISKSIISCPICQ
jgi:hypothetical protein